MNQKETKIQTTENNNQTTKQEEKVKHLVKCLSVFPKSLFVSKKKRPPAILNNLNIVLVLLFSFCSLFCVLYFCMDTGKRSSIMPTVEEWRKAKKLDVK